MQKPDSARALAAPATALGTRSLKYEKLRERCKTTSYGTVKVLKQGCQQNDPSAIRLKLILPASYGVSWAEQHNVL